MEDPAVSRVQPDLKRVDYEPYFERWNSVLFYPDPAIPETEMLLAGHSGDVGSIPCHQHKTCEGLIRAVGKYPPRVCVHCRVDTAEEQAYLERTTDDAISKEGLIVRALSSP